MSGCRQRDESYRVSNSNQIILRLAETQPPNYPSAQGAKEFARLVEQKSQGRIKVKVYDSGKLGEEISIIEQVQFGGIDLARVSLASLAKYSPKIRLVTLPYLFRNSEHMWNVLEGPVGTDIVDCLRKEKIVCLSWYEGGAKSYYNTKRQVNSVEDLKGLKISVQRSPIIMDIYSAMGLSLVPTGSSEVYSALQTGAIDGVEDTLVAYYTSKHYEVAPFFTYDEHSRIPEVIIASRVTLMQLAKNDQLLIEQAAKESAVVQGKAWLAMEKEAFKALHAMGIVITFTDTNSKNTFMSAIKPYYQRFSQDDLAAIK